MSDSNHIQEKENKDRTFLIDWKEEIINILNGKRDGLLIKSGSVRGYIEYLTKSLNPEDFKSQFEPALKEVVWSWEVHQPREKEYFVIMLELIGSFTPDGGYRKAAKFHDYWKNSISKIEDKFGYESNANLLRQIIGALSAYFNLAPEQKSSEEERYNFKHYLDLLEKYLYEPQLSGYIAVVLLKSFFVEISDKKIKKAIETESESLYNIMSYVFSGDRKHKLEENLENLAYHVFEVGGDAIDLFEKRLKVYGADFKYGQPNLTISLSNGDEIAVNFSEKAFGNFIMRKMNLHLLPQYINDLFNNNIKENHQKIQNILENCYRESAEAVLQFRKVLDRIENLKIEAEPYYDLRISLHMGESSPIYLVCPRKYQNVWCEYGKADFEQLYKQMASGVQT